MSEISLENLDYGCYSIEHEHSRTLYENIQYATSEFHRIYTQRVRLPDGRANVVYLMGKTFDECMNMLNGKNFIIPPTYRRIFYPVYYIGRYMNRRYVINNIKTKPTRDALIRKNTKLIPYSTRVMPKKITENTFFLCSDIYEPMVPIMARYPAIKNYDIFFKEFISVITGMTPAPDSKETNAKSNNRIMIIDCDSFHFNTAAGMDVNKTNPLYLMYLKFMRERTMENFGVDMDMIICKNNLFMKFNPARTTKSQFNVFKMALFRMIGANLDDYTNTLSEKDKSELGIDTTSRTINNVVQTAVEPYTKLATPTTQMAVANIVQDKVKKNTAETLAKYQATKEIQQAVATASDTKIPKNDKPSTSIHSPIGNRNIQKNPLSDTDIDFFNKIIGNYQSLATPTGQYVDDEEAEEYDDFTDTQESDLEAEVHDVLINDEQIAEEILNEIQANTAPLDKSTSPVNSERDRKLREAQKKIVVKNETIEDIIMRDSTNVPIQTEDKSAVLKTSNQNVKQIKFSNFDKTYIDTLLTKDLVACFNMLQDKNSPFYITNIDVKDSSDAMNYKETWTVSLKDETGKKHTIKVDIPKFIDNRFMLLNGSRFIILKQNFYNPLVKDTPDTVIMTTNYNKITIDRTSSKSFSSVERIFSLIKKTADNTVFIAGDNSKSNTKYISSLEYDELSRRLFKFSSNNCEIYFSRKYLQDNMASRIEVSGAKDNEFYIGHEGGTPLLINEDTGLDRNGRTITDIIYDNLSDEYQIIYDKQTKAPKQSMYVEAKLAGQMMPMIATLIVWNGISKTMDEIGVQWEFHQGMSRMPQGSANFKYIKFMDGILQYESKLYAELIMNGITAMHPEKFTFESFNTEEGYNEYIRAQFGTYVGISRLNTFNEFLIDPITRDVCRDLMLPDTPTGLLIHAAKLLSDNAYVSKASDKSFRIRSIEMIPGILYYCLATQYTAYVNSGRKIPMTLRQNAVISALMAEKTVENYSTLNPVVEVSKTNTISTKGYRGSNSDMAYKNEEKRAYDPSSVGKLAMSTSPKKYWHWASKTS